MADLTPIPGWTPVPRYETSTPALGGAGAPMNTQAQALLNRTEQLRTDLDDLTDSVSNVDNTSDAAKPISTATQAALDLKAPLADPIFTGTVSGVTKAMVGLGNVDNTSDLSKPISTAVSSALGGKAPLTDPTFTGTITTVNSANGLQVTGGTGNVTLSGGVSGATATVNKIAGAYSSALYGSRASSSRWLLELGNATNETGSNAGSDFAISRFADNGSFLSTPFVILRSTGTVYVNTILNATTDFNAGGAVNLGSTVNVSGLLTTSGQVKFPSTANPSSDATTLDDYREGTWTPVNASGNGVPISIFQATYVKVGRMVTISMQVTIGANAQGHNLQFVGLPFNGNGAGPLAIGYHNSGNSNVTAMLSGSTLSIYVGGSFATFAQFSGAQLYVGGSYMSV